MKAVHFFAVALLAAAAAVARAEEPFYLQPRLIDALSTQLATPAEMTAPGTIEFSGLLTTPAAVDVAVTPSVGDTWSGLLVPPVTAVVQSLEPTPRVHDQLLAPTESDWRQNLYPSIDWSLMTTTTLLQQPTFGNFVR
jgi:hypothetical protein